MWRSLVWKEWREQRWRLGFGVLLLGMFTLIGLRTRIMPDEQIVALTIMVGGIVFPLMVAMGLIAPERSEGTIVRLLALPVRPWQVLAAKALVGTAVCAGPMIVSAMIAALVAGDREMAWREFGELYAIAVGVVLSVFGWFTAAGVRQPSEARAGLAGVGVIAVWALLIGLGGLVEAELLHSATTSDWVAAASPFGLVVMKGGNLPSAAVIGMQFVTFAAVWGWAAYRIGKPGKVVA